MANFAPELTFGPATSGIYTPDSGPSYRTVLLTGTPSLVLDFLSGGLPSGITISGGANGTVVNSAGLIVAASAPRFDYDPVTLAPKGLLIEEQRGNLRTYSSDFSNAIWPSGVAVKAPNAAVGPDGLNSAVSYTLASAASYIISGSVGVVTGTQLLLSVYVKRGNFDSQANFNFGVYDNTAALDKGYITFNFNTLAVTLSYGTVSSMGAIPAGNGWYRIWACIPVTSGNVHNAYWGGIGAPGVAGNYWYMWGPQVEVGAFVTSYIPTTSAAVTRSADVASMTGTNFSSWFNPGAGSFIVGFDTNYSTSPGSQWILGMDGSVSKRLGYAQSGTGTISSYDGSTVISTPNTVLPGPSKAASAYTSTGRSICGNGGSVATGTVAAGYSTSTSLDIGGINGGNFLNGHIRSLTYYPQQLPDAMLQALTA